MDSQGLLPELDQIPLRGSHPRYRWTDVVDWSRRMRGESFIVESGVGGDSALSALLRSAHVPPELNEAYKLAFPQVSAEEPLRAHYLEMVHRGPESTTGFVSNLKGKLAELQLPEALQKEFPGYHFTLAGTENQPGWDLRGVDSHGAHEILVQAKVGGAGYTGQVLDQMHDHHDVYFAVSGDIRDTILAHHPEMASQLLGHTLSNLDVTGDVNDNLALIAHHSNIDVPDSLVDIAPYIREIVLGIRLLVDIVITEREFKEVSFDDRKRVHAMKALLLMQRFGVSTVCTLAGSAIASPVAPPWGTAVGSLGGAGVSIILSRKLKPRMTSVALWLCRLTEDDLFYLRNKKAIDGIGNALMRSA